MLLKVGRTTCKQNYAVMNRGWMTHNQNQEGALADGNNAL